MQITKLQAAAVCLLIAASFALSAPAAAQSLDLLDLGAPSFTTFSSRDGVPDSVIVSVQTDREGFVWLASSQGLARYDGHRWNAVDAPAIKGTLADLTVDHEGTLWAAFRDRGLARFDGKQWHFEDVGSAKNDRVRRLTETVDAHGHYQLWTTTFGAGLFLRDGTHWVPAKRNEQLPNMTISVARTTKIGGHERLWVGTLNEGVWFREDGDWQRFAAPHFDGSQIEGLLCTTNRGHEELWISTFGAGLWRIDDEGNVRSWTIANGAVPTDDFYQIAQTESADGDGEIWVASRAGLARIHGDHAQVFDRRYGLPSNVVRGFSVWRSPDGIDVLWLATEHGVARAIASGSPWQTASLMGLNASGVFGLLIEPDDDHGERLWVASSFDGLGLYEHQRWQTIVPVDDALKKSEMRFVKRDHDQLWIGFGNGGLASMGGDHIIRSADAPWPRTNRNAITDMLVRSVDGHEEQWFATRIAGLYRLRDGNWTAFPPPNSQPPWRTTSLVEQIDANGRSWVWATGVGSLQRFDGEKIDVIGREIGLPDSILLGISLIADAQSRQILWVGTSGEGIARVDVSDPLHPKLLARDLPAAPDPTVYSAKRDATGHIYLCTNNGVQMLTPKANGYDSRVFTRRDGMVHDECNTNAQVIDAKGRFWTGTLGGVTVFDPSLERIDHQRKPLKLTGVHVDANAVPTEHVQLPPGDHDLRIDFALLSWHDENESAFRTQLVGYDAEPSAWTSQNFRSFNALPPGDFTLHIQARDYAGNESDRLDVKISVLPEWWQTSWARALLGAACFLFAYAVFNWRTRVLRAQRRRLEQQVGTRTAELHAANARLVELSYKDALTGLANRRRLLDALNATPASGETKALSLVFVDVDHFKAYNDRFGHPAGDEALRRVAGALLERTPADALVARYGGEEFAILLAGIGKEPALALADEIRRAIEALTVDVPGTDQINRVTISAGVACREVTSSDDAHLLLRDADIALYQAKRDGRNCVRG